MQELSALIVRLMHLIMAIFVKKLNIAPNIFNFDRGFSIMVSTNIDKPFPRIRLCPIYKNYKLGAVDTIFKLLILPHQSQSYY